MDLLDIHNQEDNTLYFNEDLPENVIGLLEQAAEDYIEGTGELCLQQAATLAPESLTVLVAQYRFYYYRHRFTDALAVAHRSLEVSGERLQLPNDWRQLTLAAVEGCKSNLNLLRFYLFALKGAAYLNMRLGNLELAGAMLDTVMALDSEDRIGGRVLKQVLVEHHLNEAA